MQNELERTMRMNYLYDFYQSLLTDKQKTYIELYYLEDYSLSEIGETLEVTRQAVYDNVKRSTEMLEHYERHLAMYDAYLQRQSIIETLQDKVTDSEILHYIERLEKLQ